MEFQLTVGDLASDQFEYFVNEDDRERDFQYREPLLEVQWSDLEDGLFQKQRNNDVIFKD
jgi:hypothetical protein